MRTRVSCSVVPRGRGDPRTDRTTGSAAMQDLDAFIRAGVTTLDTADVWGPNEALVGQYLRLHPWRRQEVQVRGVRGGAREAASKRGRRGRPLSCRATSFCLVWWEAWLLSSQRRFVRRWERVVFWR